MNTTAWKSLLDEGLEAEAYPCYAVAVGRGDELYFRAFGGKRACFPVPLPLTEDTLFDMASLSKLMGTTMAALRLIERGTLRLSDRVGDYFADCHGKEEITVYRLMTHTSGIPAHFSMWRMGIAPEETAETILAYPLAAPTGTTVIYSCMGYILLGKMLEKLCGEPLDRIVRREVLDPLGMHETCYCPGSERICAATEKKAGREDYICGQVHDENAHSLGGIAGNAGLFAPLDDMIRFAEMLSRRGEGYLSPAIFSDAIADHTSHLPGDARGLGFQLYRDGVYAGGSCMAKGSYGHNGFTGPALYVDRESGVYCAFLSNRVHFGRDTEVFYTYRRAFYDRVFSDLKEEIE